MFFDSLVGQLNNRKDKIMNGEDGSMLLPVFGFVSFQ